MVTVLLAANHGATGSLTVYQYIQAVYLLPYAVLAVPVAISTFPALVAEDVAGEEAAGADAAGRAGRCRRCRGTTVLRRRRRRAPTAAATVAAPTLAAPTLARSARAVVLAMGLGAGVLVAVAGPVASVFTVIDAGRSASAGSTALAAMPSGLVAFAPGLVGFGLMALLTRALYVRGRPALAGRWVAAGWLVAALGSLVVLVGGTVSSRRLLVSLGVASTLGMTLAAVGLVLTVRSAWGATALDGADPVARRLRGRRRGSRAGRRHGGRRRADVRPAASVGAGVLAAALTLVVFVVVVAAGDRDSGRVAPGPVAPEPGMRVVLLVGRSTGGIGTHVGQLVADLRQLGLEVVVVTHPLTAQRFGWGDARTWWPRDPRHPWPPYGTCDGCAPWWPVPTSCTRTGTRPVCSPRCSRSPRPRPGLVVSQHNLVLAGSGLRRVKAAAQRLVARRADLVTGASTDLVEQARALGAADARLARVPSPKVPALLARAGARRRGTRRPGRPPRPCRRRPLGSGADRPQLVLTVSRIAPQKDLEVLVTAAAAVHAACRFVVVGDGDPDLRARLQEQIRRTGAPVELVGARDDVAQLLRAADVFVLPSAWEARALVVQEAMAAGTPVVASDVGGLQRPRGRLRAAGGGGGRGGPRPRGRHAAGRPGPARAGRPCRSRGGRGAAGRSVGRAGVGALVRGDRAVPAVRCQICAPMT